MGICTNCPCGYCVIPLGEECPIKGCAINEEVVMGEDAIQKLTYALLEKDKGTVLPIDLNTCYEYGMRGLCGNKCPDFGSKCECGEEVANEND